MENKTLPSVSDRTHSGSAQSADDSRAVTNSATMVNATMVNETLVRDSVSVGRVARGTSPAEESPITEYNSAVNYISSLIDQLRQAGPVPKGSEPETPPNDAGLDARATMPVGVPSSPAPPFAPAGPRQDATLVLDSDRSPTTEKGPVVPSLMRAMDATLRPEDMGSIIRRKQRDDDLIDDDADADAVASEISEMQQQLDQEMGRERGQHMLHNLREAAYLATTTSLELKDCATYAHRAYYSGFFGIASSLFSITFILMSPRTNTFGFAASVGAFAAACGLWMAFMISYRLLVRTSQKLKVTM